jgi:hypothetical protein
LQTNNFLSHKSRHKTPNLLGENPDFFPKCKNRKVEISFGKILVAEVVGYPKIKFVCKNIARFRKMCAKYGGRTSPKCQKTSFFGEKSRDFHGVLHNKTGMDLTTFSTKHPLFHHKFVISR